VITKSTDGSTNSQYILWGDDIPLTISLNTSCKTTLSPIANTAISGVKRPQYGLILDLDRKLRNGSPPPEKLAQAVKPIAQVADFTLYSHPSMRWQEHLIYSMKAYSRLLLHRAHYVQALYENSEDIVQSRWIQSVNGLLESTKTLIEHYTWLKHNEADTLQRLPLWPIHMLSCAVSMPLDAWILSDR